ncbi:hypothetical protein KFE25_000979 [Diacronema lutheri]|uniref:Inositol polyphosphate-related phosphatase domain-containing protein n=4 Tax=Diacronema lutheri TaxID=2081491 RepID=A0A8J6C9P6_DIALT|nr:hypothetical protein KFE25_000979 [Diacronema lutheri]
MSVYVPASKVAAREDALRQARGLGAADVASCAAAFPADAPPVDAAPLPAGAVGYAMGPYAARVAELEHKISEMPPMHMPAAVPAIARPATLARIGPTRSSAAYPLPWAVADAPLGDIHRFGVVVRDDDPTRPSSLGVQRLARAPSWAHAERPGAAAPPREQPRAEPPAASPATDALARAAAGASAPRVGSAVAAAPTGAAQHGEAFAELQLLRGGTTSYSDAASADGADDADGDARADTGDADASEPSGVAHVRPLASAELLAAGEAGPRASARHSAASDAAAGAPAAAADAAVPVAGVAAGVGAAPGADVPPGERALFLVVLASGAEPPLLDECARVVEPRGASALRACDLVLSAAAPPAVPPSRLADAPAAPPAEMLAALVRAARGAPIELRVLRTSLFAPLAPEPAPVEARHAPLARACLVTWNMHGKEPPAAVPELLRARAPSGARYDLFAIGSQEAERSIEASILNSSKARWEAAIEATLGAEYVLVASHRLAAMHLAIYARAALAPLISGARTAHVATGFGNALGNKGAVGVSLMLGETSFCFISCHLTAHQGAVRARNADFARIDESLELWPPAGAPRARVPRAGAGSVSARFDRVFWLGDFNYRVHGNRAIVDRLLARREEAEARAAGWASADECAREGLRVLLRNDQLTLQRRSGAVFRGLVEGEISFRPTYKFDSKRRDVYDQSEKARIPAWTDRILFAPGRATEPDPDTAVQLHAYDSIASLTTSDHRPVVADLSVRYELGAGAARPQAADADAKAGADADAAAAADGAPASRARGGAAQPLIPARSYTRAGGGRTLDDAPPPALPAAQRRDGTSALCVVS